MAGKIKIMIDKIVQERSKGNATLVLTTKAKITLKGVDPDKWSAGSPDDPDVLTKLRQIAQEFGIAV